MHRTTPSDAFRAKLSWPLNEALNHCMSRGVVFRFRLDCPWYLAVLKGHTIAEGFTPATVVRQASDHLTALDNLKGI